jgi:hypothetical protein
MKTASLAQLAQLLAAACIAPAVADDNAADAPLPGDVRPAALRKMPTDPGEKFYPEYLAFAERDADTSPPRPAVFFEPPSSTEAAEAARQWFDQEEARLVAAASNGTSPADTRLFRPPYALHEDQDPGLVILPGIFRRGVHRRSSCPSGMSDCSSVGAANKCCASGTYCAAIDDEDAGNVACCPDGAACEGNVGTCPADAVECDASLGGGCCLTGWVCFGIGCEFWGHE